MLEIKNTDVYGLKKALIRSGYPMQIGDPSDLSSIVDGEVPNNEEYEIMVNAINRARKLGKVPTGTGHDNFLKGINVTFDVKFPQYWTPQFQRYSFADIISSQSKMHKLTSVKDLRSQCNSHVFSNIIEIVEELIELYNEEQNFPVRYNITNTLSKEFTSKKDIFMAIVSNLPMGYEMWMGVTTNYLQLKTIYHQRRNHKLEDWHVFCDWCEELPMFKDLIGLNE